MALTQVNPVEKKRKVSPLETFATIIDIGQSVADIKSSVAPAASSTDSLLRKLVGTRAQAAKFAEGKGGLTEVSKVPLSSLSLGQKMLRSK